MDEEGCAFFQCGLDRQRSTYKCHAFLYAAQPQQPTIGGVLYDVEVTTPTG